MSDQIKDGGPAFPQSHHYCEHCGTMQTLDTGMSLRDWFAGMALQGFCANPAVFASNPNSGWSLVNCNDEQLVGYCAYLADAMLAEMEKSHD